MNKNYCGYGEPIYEDDYSYCELDNEGNPITPPRPVIVALYCHKINDYCNGYNPEVCDKSETINNEFKEYCAAGTYCKRIECEVDEEYRLLVVSEPLDDDPMWRFCIEIGYPDGSADTTSVELTDEEKESIKQQIYQLKQKVA